MIEINTKDFYGPFDVLLKLIDNAKISIYDIEINKITKDFIEEIEHLDLSADRMTDFIDVATILIKIKTRSLIEDKIDIEDDIEDEINREKLIEKLIEYRKFKNISKELIKNFNADEFIYTKLQDDLNQYKLNDKEEIISADLESITAIMEEIINRNKEIIENELIVEKIIESDDYSVEEYSKNIFKKLKVNKELNISKMIYSSKNKKEMIVVFLSVLELVRKDHVVLRSVKKDILIKIEG